jgi:hypothetical protein
MPPKRRQHPLLSNFIASNPKVAMAIQRASMARPTVMGGLGGFGMMQGNGGLLLGGAKKPRRETVGRAKNQARGALVRQVMMQHGMSLPQASHYIKMKNIPF